MGSRNLIPLVIFELELETVEVLKRGLADKMKPNKLVTLILLGAHFLSFIKQIHLTFFVLYFKASPQARQLGEHPHSPHLLQAGGGGRAVLLQARVSELDLDRRP